MNERLRKGLLIGATSILALAGAQLGVRVVSRRFLYRGRGTLAVATPADAREHIVVAADGITVHTLELFAGARAPVLVHFHGNRETTADGVPFARSLRARGVGVVLVEYRGYGASLDSEPTEEGLYLDAEAVLGDLARRSIDRSRVLLSGASLGTGVAAEMARRGRGSALVLLMPYTSIPDLVRDHAPLVPARQLLPDTFDTLAKAPQIAVPTLVVHGDHDAIVPHWMGATIAQALPEGRFLSIAGGHHHDLLERASSSILDAIVALTRVLPRKSL